jgi:hypothetical protein
MKLNNNELQLLIDGLEDTTHRLAYDSKVNEDYDSYTKRVIVLKKKLLKEIKRG